MALLPGIERFFDFSVTLKKDKPFRSAGFEVAHEQFKLEGNYKAPVSEANHNDLKTTEVENKIVVEGENFELIFDKASGTISSYEINGVELIKSGPKVNFWRPANDNDKGSGMLGRLGIWREISREIKPAEITLEKTSGKKVAVNVNYTFNQVDANQEVTYSVSNDGKIEINSSIKINGEKVPDLPRFGMRWEMPVNFDNLEYYGRGPQENYIDRNRSAFVGIYNSKVADQYFNYVRPQENGNKTGVRWFELRNENGFGLRVTGDVPIGFSALHNPIEDFDMENMQDYRHTNDIVKHDGVFITTDLNQMGVAGDNSWGARPYKEYSLPARDYEFGFTIEPIF